MTDIVHKVTTRNGHALFTDHGRCTDYAVLYHGIISTYGRSEFTLAGFIVFDADALPLLLRPTRKECEEYVESSALVGCVIQEFFLKEQKRES